jgi:MSHA pilin protein MshC
MSSAVTNECASRSDGYTVIELVVVITILGVIAAIAGPRFFDTSPFNQRGYADEVASAIRYAQKVAVGSGCSVQLTINLSGYSAMQQAASGNRCNPASGSWTTPVRRIDGTLLAGTPPNDANVNTSATMVFNNRGAVVSGASNLSVGSYTLTLDAATGFVTVQ